MNCLRESGRKSRERVRTAATFSSPAPTVVSAVKRLFNRWLALYPAMCPPGRADSATDRSYPPATAAPVAPCKALI